MNERFGPEPCSVWMILGKHIPGQRIFRPVWKRSKANRVILKDDVIWSPSSKKEIKQIPESGDAARTVVASPLGGGNNLATENLDLAIVGTEINDLASERIPVWPVPIDGGLRVAMGHDRN